MFEKSLVQIGLSKNEALLYDLLLSEGELSAGLVIKKSKLKRGLTYKVLHELEEKGFNKSLRKNKKLHFKRLHHEELNRFEGELLLREMENREKILDIGHGTEARHMRSLKEAGKDVYGFDLNSKEEFPVIINDADQTAWDISGNIVVWNDGVTGIYGYDLLTQDEFSICTDGVNMRDVRISGNYVVWSDYRNDVWDIYGAEIIPEPAGLTLFVLGSITLMKRKRR